MSAAPVQDCPHPAPLSGARYSAVELMPGDRQVVMLDQRRLPHEQVYSTFTRVAEVAEGIRAMVIRGAPAIGLAAAYGLVLAAGEAAGASEDVFVQKMAEASEILRRTRPTAVNLAWALEQLQPDVAAVAAASARERVSRLAEHARALHRSDVAACRAMGEHGAARVPNDAVILTHCNAGALATGGFGSALGVVRAAVAAGKRVRVLATETRPYLQGARLTAWELQRDGIEVTLVGEGAVAHLFARGAAAEGPRRAVDLVVVGADRIARSGDVANKIGTYGIACLAQLHEVPFYVAAPVSTIDLGTETGDAIPIEERSSDEVTHLSTARGAPRIAPADVPARNPAFDVTPARLVRAVFTETGVASPVNERSIARLAGR